MSKKGYQLAFDLLLIFGVFFLSNASAFLYVLWLTPDFVVFEFALWVILTAFTIWLLKNNLGHSALFQNLKINWAILPFLVFSLLSLFWSVYWEISLYRWLMLLFTIVTGAYIGLNYPLRKIIEFLSVFGIYVLLFSTILVLFVPHRGVMNYYIIQGAWRGIYWHKNHMGLIAAFISIVFLIRILSASLNKEKRIILPWVALYLFSLLFVYQTDSVAAYITTLFLHGIVALALLFMKFGRNFRRTHFLLFLAAAIFMSLVLFLNLDTVFGIFNRSPSLTGRIPMWTFLLDAYLRQRPFFGYGFNSFWYIESHRIAIQQAAAYPDQIVIADNGFIDILINTGWIGLILFLIFYLNAWWRSVKCAISAREINGIFPVLLMSFTLIANVSWSLIFENEGFFMLIMISILFCLSAETTKSAEG